MGFVLDFAIHNACASIMQVSLAFNGWRLGHQEYDMQPAEAVAGLPDTDGCRWFAAKIEVPTEARQVSFGASHHGSRRSHALCFFSVAFADKFCKLWIRSRADELRLLR